MTYLRHIYTEKLTSYIHRKRETEFQLKMFLSIIPITYKEVLPGGPKHKQQVLSPVIALNEKE